MKKVTDPSSPDAYVASLSGWQHSCVSALREAVTCAEVGLQEVIKWGHLVYICNGPVLLIRAEQHRVLFGFWRGQRLRTIEPRLKPGGKYEMASLELHEKTALTQVSVARLVRKAVALNATFGDPTKLPTLQGKNGL